MNRNVHQIDRDSERRDAAPDPRELPPPEAVKTAFKQLGELKAAGVLTDAEFDAKKKELLAKL